MSITRGIEIKKKEPGADNTINNNHFVSWKDRNFNMWVSEWIFTYIPEREMYERSPEGWSFAIKKDDLLKMADDLIEHRFSVCSETYDGFFDELVENYAYQFGLAFRTLAEKVKDDELLRYYDAGD